MKKTFFALAVFFATAFCTQTTVYAEDDIPLLSEEVLAEEPEEKNEESQTSKDGGWDIDELDILIGNIKGKKENPFS